MPYLVKCKCQETTDNLKQMSRLIIKINFNLNLLQLIMFLLIYVTVNIKTVIL